MRESDFSDGGRSQTAMSGKRKYKTENSRNLAQREGNKWKNDRKP